MHIQEEVTPTQTNSPKPTPTNTSTPEPTSTPKPSLNYPVDVDGLLVTFTGYEVATCDNYWV